MSTEETEHEAAAWLARHDRGLSPDETAALDRWLDADTLNRVAYLRLRAAWQRADRMSALRSPVVFAPPRRSQAHFVLLATAALLLAVMAGATTWFLIQPESSQTYVTTIGGTQTVRLADGTKLVLNTNTRLRADTTFLRRAVILESGEAYFDVVHDGLRPFIVYAGNRRITDLGTKFSVFRNGDDVRVTVQEGQVEVDARDRATSESDTPIVVQAGHIVVTKGNETLVSLRSNNDIRDDLAWRSGRLIFDQQPLGAAAAQFNRYNKRKIVVEGGARHIRIGGSFKTDNVNGFVLLLHRGFGLSVDDRGDQIVVSR